MAIIGFETYALATIAVISVLINHSPCIQANDNAQDRLNEVLGRFNGMKLTDAKKDEGCTSKYNVDHLELRMTWGPGYCSVGKTSCRSNIKPEFTIHGLWPTQRDTESPTNCCTEQKFNINSLAPIKAKLQRYWPSLNGMHEQDFWPYQWNKHGSCATKIYGLNNVYDFFNFAVNSIMESDITKVMSSNQFKPSNEKLYSGHAIVMALAGVYGSKVSIRCSPLKNKPEVQVITDFSACFDTKLKLVDCPYAKKKCLSEVLFPAKVLR